MSTHPLARCMRDLKSTRELVRCPDAGELNSAGEHRHRYRRRAGGVSEALCLLFRCPDACATSTPPVSSSAVPIHATNAWNPTGRNLLPIPGTRLYYAHAEALNGPRTFVLLGDQQHLT